MVSLGFEPEEAGRAVEADISGRHLRQGLSIAVHPVLRLTRQRDLLCGVVRSPTDNDFRIVRESERIEAPGGTSLDRPDKGRFLKMSVEIGESVEARPPS